ncbi:MAG: adenosylcobinamide-GDP ribazoletransferase [Bacteroidaceae bacterium]|nr:adenosylcobinamide-GDP ribazoletransferase [Bacteroidaceae bacterium]
MHTDTEQSPWYDRIWAALIFFTRLPFWRIHEPARESYKTVVEFWPLTGWLTGGLMAATLYFGSMYLPYIIAVLLAIVVRLLVTGALHEDGLADFFDGFGGGTDRGRILAIMKDSHIGTFGVLGLILYILLLASALFSMPPVLASLAIIAADPFAKMLTAGLITLPYARSEEEAKARVVYRSLGRKAILGLALQGLLPMAVIAIFFFPIINYQLSIINWLLPCLVLFFLYYYIRRRLQGYTGDCCGAVCLIVELTTLLVFSAQQVIINFPFSIIN